MTDTSQYKPPEVWVWEKGDSPNWRYSSMNRPIAGATHEKVLPRGKHPLQLYSLGTPNGVKVTILLEELLAAGHLDRAVEVASELRAADLAEVLDYLDGDPHEALVRAMPAEVVAPLGGSLAFGGRPRRFGWPAID